MRIMDGRRGDVEDGRFITDEPMVDGRVGRIAQGKLHLAEKLLALGAIDDEETGRLGQLGGHHLREPLAYVAQFVVVAAHLEVRHSHPGRLRPGSGCRAEGTGNSDSESHEDHMLPHTPLLVDIISSPGNRTAASVAEGTPCVTRVRPRIAARFSGRLH